MFRSCLVLAFRHLIRQRRHSLINVFGLALGITCCLLMALAVEYELGFDRFHDHGPRIHRVFLEDTSGQSGRPGTLLPGDLPDVVVRSVPHVSAVTGFIQAEGDIGIGVDKFGTEVGLVDPAFLEVFSFPISAGDGQTALADVDAIVLSESLARRIFEGAPEAAIGQSVTLNGRQHVVRAIVADVPQRSSLQFQCLIRPEHRNHFGINRNMLGETTVFVLAGEGVAQSTLEDALTALVPTTLRGPISNRLGDDFTEERLADFRLGAQPLADIHLDDSVESNYVRVADPAIAWIMSSVAAVILIVACINFATLTTAGAARRAREVGVRKVAGARQRQLALQFWGETALLCVLACGLGVALAQLVLPAFGQLTGQPLSLTQLYGWRGLGYIGGILGVAVIAAGSYPAIQLSRERPAHAVRGSVRQRHRTPLLRGLLIAQYALGIGFLVATLTMIEQIQYVLGARLGYDPQDVVVVYVPGEGSAERFQAEIAGLPSVVSTTASDRAFTNGSYTIGLQSNDGSWGSIRMIRIDDHYLETLKIELVDGRNLDLERPTDLKHAVLVNESTVRQLGWTDPVGRILPISGVNDAPQPTIVGVVKDFHIDSLHRGIQPLFLTMNPAFHGIGFVMVRTQPGMATAILPELSTAWSRVVPDEPFQSRLLEERLQSQYRDEETACLLLGYAAGFIVLISCMGLVGHAALAVVRRTREIGIRKALGASIASILGLLGRESLSLLVVSSAVGWPAAWWLMSGWLEGFAYRITLGPEPFLVGTAIALALAAVVVISQSAGAALRSPVVALRHE